jgi:hypothetical protein
LILDLGERDAGVGFMILERSVDRYLRNSAMLSSIQMERMIPYLNAVLVLNKAKLRFELTAVQVRRSVAPHSKDYRGT